MRIRWLLDARELILLSLFATVCILLAAASAVFTVQAKLETMRARAVVERADSLVRDWTARGCAPRSKALP